MLKTDKESAVDKLEETFQKFVAYRREVLSDLEKRSKILQIMTSQMQDMIFYKDKDLRYVFSNKPHCHKILHLTEEEYIGKTDEEISEILSSRDIRNDFLKIYQRIDKQVIDASTSMTFTERGIVNGQELILEIIATPYYNEFREFLGIIGCARDITHLIRERREVSQRDIKYKAIVDNCSDAIITCNSDLQIVHANKTAERMFGYESGQLTNKNIADLRSASNNPLVKVIQPFMLNSDIPPQSVYIGVGLKSNGIEFPIEVKYFSWECRGEIYYSMIIRDITEQHMLFSAFGDLDFPAFALIDEELNIIYLSKNFRNLYGDLPSYKVKCYQFIRGREQPCDNCYCCHVLNSGEKVRIFSKSENNKFFYFTLINPILHSKQVKRAILLEFIVDIDNYVLLDYPLFHRKHDSK